MIDPILARKDGESFDDYHIRLFENKDEYGIDKFTIRDLLNKESGTVYDESKWRKDYAQYVKWKQYFVDANVDSDAVLNELKLKQKELEFAKIQLQDQRREYKKYLRHEGRLDYLLKQLLDSIKDDINNKKPLEWYRQDEKAQETDKVVALLLSDIHKGLDTDNHWNTYNTEVFYERLNQVVNETIEYKNVHRANELHIFQLGDLIHGVIHRLSRLGDTEDAVKSTQLVAEAFSEMVAKFANEFDKVVFRSVKGNHDRTQSRKEEEIRTESFHEFIPWYMKARLEKFENVIFEENKYDDEIIVADILGHTYFGVHGHLDSLGKVITDLTMMTHKFPTAVFSAHIHKNYENEIHGVDLIVNGGFAGTDDYAKDKRLLSKAHQKLMILDEYGRADTHYIRFNKKETVNV